jgi:hypothetical protein
MLVLKTAALGKMNLVHTPLQQCKTWPLRTVIWYSSAVSLTESVCYRGAFMFLKPSLSKVSVIYELAFSTSVWVAYAVIVAILTVVLIITRRVHKRMDTSSSESSVGWADTIMDSLAIVCQQGDSGHTFLLLGIRSLKLYVPYTRRTKCWSWIRDTQLKQTKLVQIGLPFVPNFLWGSLLSVILTSDQINYNQEWFQASAGK